MATAVAVKGKNKNTDRSAVSALQTFAWVGTDKRGIKLRGDELGKNENLIRAELRKRGISPLEITSDDDPVVKLAQFFHRRKMRK